MARNSKKAAGLASKHKHLQTTVHANDPTVVLGRAPALGQTVRASGLPNFGKIGLRTRLASGVSHVAQRISPKVIAPTPIGGGFAYDRKANRRLRKIAKQMARQQPRKPRSRVPLVIMLLLGMITGFGYYTYKVIPWQSIGQKAGEYLDYNDWLAKAAGKKKPSAFAIDNSTVNAEAPKTKIVKRVIKRRVVADATRSPTKKTYVSSSQKSGSMVAAGKRNGAKQSLGKKKSTPAQKKAWQQGLAKLKKQSASDYRRASHKYRTKN